MIVHQDNLCYGLVVLVPLLSTSHRWDAVTVRYRTVLHRTEADFHHSGFLPSQAHYAAPDGAGISLKIGFLQIFHAYGVGISSLEIGFLQIFRAHGVGAWASPM